MATQREFAEHVGITQQAVSDLTRRGVLAKGGSLDDWRLAYCQHIREQAAGRATGGDLNLAHERARLAKLQADKVELDLAKMRGDLIPADEVEREWSDIIAAVRARLLALPSQAAAELAGKVPRREVEALVRRVVYQALRELARDGQAEDEAEGA